MKQEVKKELDNLIQLSKDLENVYLKNRLSYVNNNIKWGCDLNYLEDKN